jgi:hypothetical protein
LFDFDTLGCGERPVMRSRDGLAGEVIQRTSQPLGHTPGIHEDQRGSPAADDLQHARIDALPH